MGDQIKDELNALVREGLQHTESEAYQQCALPCLRRKVPVATPRPAATLESVLCSCDLVPVDVNDC